MSLTLPRLIATALLATALPLAVHAQEKDSQGGTPTDAGFYKNASASGIAEVEMSQLALKQSSSPSVQKFAQRMVEDHGKANDELKTLKSGDKGYSMVTEPDPDAQKAIDAMTRLKGAEFDKAYAKQMVADHEVAVAAFEVEIEKGSNPKLKDFAKKTLPTLKHHLEMAKSLPTR
ncbi:hypothetical protein KCV01_g20157, partial [Aureobasidium melanogenum]